MRTECPKCSAPILIGNPFLAVLPCSACGAELSLDAPTWHGILGGAVAKTVRAADGAQDVYADFEDAGQFHVRYTRRWPACVACSTPIAEHRVEAALAAGVPYVCGECGKTSSLRPVPFPTTGRLFAVRAVLGEIVSSPPAAGARSFYLLICPEDYRDRERASIPPAPSTVSVAAIQLLSAWQDDPLTTPWLHDGIGAENERQWCLMLQTPLAVLNAYDPRLLGGFSTREEALEAGLSSMVTRDWEVTDETTLLEALEWLRADGHRREYAARLRAPDVPDWLASLQRSHRCLDNSPFVAWDAGRMVALAGWGAVLGYTSSWTAYRYILGAAASVQPAYRDWSEYIWAYMLGLQVWQDGAMDEQLLARLLMLVPAKDKMWTATPWDRPLVMPADAPPPLPMATWA